MVPLPPYARRVEYLESTGTQWIDTGVRGAGSGYLATKFMAMPVSDTSVYWRYFGASNGGTPDSRTIAVWSRTSVYYENGTTSRNLGGTGTIVTLDKQAYRVPEGTTVGDFNFKIFGYNGPTNLGSARFWYFQLWDSSGTIVRSFVPCRILDTGYLWDEVEGKFYGNSGTGDFVLGPDVREGVVPTRLNPFGVGRRQESIRRVEYLESTGTQWIDTGLVVTPTMRMTVDMAVTNWDADTYSLTGASGIRFAFGKGWQGSSTNTSANQGRLYFGLGEQNLATSQTLPPLKGVRHKYGLDAATATGWLDGTSYSLSSAGTIATGTRPIVLFAQSTGATSVRGRQAAKLYGAIFTDNGAVVRDFVPVVVGSNGYLLDKVSGRLFGNDGTGDFVVGPDFVPHLRVWGDGTQSSLFDISTPYPLAAGNPVTGTVNGDARSGILASDLYTVNDAGGDYVGEFIDMTPGGTGSWALRWFDSVAGSPLLGYCEIVQ